MQRNGTVFVDVDRFEDEFEVVFMLQHVVGKFVKVQQIVTIIVGTTHEHLSRSNQSGTEEGGIENQRMNARLFPGL